MGDSKNFERRLSAMAFADVAGWSKLISADAAGAINQWRRVRLEVITPRIEEHGGRLVEMAGDAVLVEFSSVVSAVQWALDVQGSVNDRDAAANGMKLQLRVAVNIDEVIVDDGILQGEGVNIAARIHQVGMPGQIVATEAVRDYVQRSFRSLLSSSVSSSSRMLHNASACLRWKDLGRQATSLPVNLT